MKTMHDWLLHGGPDGGPPNLGLDGLPYGGWAETEEEFHRLCKRMPPRSDRLWVVGDLGITVYDIKGADEDGPGWYVRRPDFLARAEAWDEAAANLADALVDMTLALDPQRQGNCWPDPIAWDGRPLIQQAGDTASLAQANIRPMDPSTDVLRGPLRQLRRAIHAFRVVFAKDGGS